MMSTYIKIVFENTGSIKSFEQVFEYVKSKGGRLLTTYELRDYIERKNNNQPLVNNSCWVAVVNQFNPNLKGYVQVGKNIAFLESHVVVNNGRTSWVCYQMNMF